MATSIMAPSGISVFRNPIRSQDLRPKPEPQEPPGNASAQGQALLNPAPVTATTPVNPMQQEAFSRSADYEKNLAAGTNEEITRELQRARDDISVGMKAEGEAAMGRGADAGFFRSRAQEAGKRDLSNLQGRLADAALRRRHEALGGVREAAGSAAGEQRMMHLGTLASQAENQRILNDQASSQARLYEAPYQRLMEMLRTTGGLTQGGVGLEGVGGSSGSGGLASGGGRTGVFGSGVGRGTPQRRPGLG